MRERTNFKANSVAIIVAVVVLAGHGWGYAPDPHRQILKGPWELAVKMGMKAEEMRFPVSVSDENKAERLDRVLPVMGTPIEIKLREYVPDLFWETTVSKQLGGGTVARLTIKGEGLEQEMWLDSNDRSRQSISSSIGSIAVKRLRKADSVKAVVKKRSRSEFVGVLTVWSTDANVATEYVVGLAETVAVPGLPYKFTVLDYVPHYSIDLETKNVFSASDKPVNPAIKIRIDDGQSSNEEWIWSKFRSPVGHKKRSPLRIEFMDFDLGGKEGQYFLLVAPQAKPWLLFSKEGKEQSEKVEFGKSYPFTNKAYSFSVESISEGAAVKSSWRNNTEVLASPAVIVTIGDGDSEQEAVLELNKASQLQTKYGPVILVYRRQR